MENQSRQPQIYTADFDRSHIPECRTFLIMNALPISREDLFCLFEAAVYGTLSAKESQNLQEALKHDALARLLWFEFNDMEFGLIELLTPLPNAVAERGCREQEPKAVDLRTSASPDFKWLRSMIQEPLYSS